MIRLRSETSESSPGFLPFGFDDDDDDDAALACLRPLRITDQRSEKEGGFKRQHVVVSTVDITVVAARKICFFEDEKIESIRGL